MQNAQVPDTPEEMEQYVKRAEQFAAKEHGAVNKIRKIERRIIDELASEEKYAKLDLLRELLPLIEEPVNYWDNSGKRIQRKKEEAERARLLEERKKRVDQYQQEMLSPKPHKPEFNKGCRYYCETVSKSSVTHECTQGMDMSYCSKRCAFATNVACSTQAYSGSETVNGKRRWDGYGE